MAEFDLVVRGGEVATGYGTTRCDIGVKEGQIVALAEKLEASGDVVDATGLLVLPGGVDTHCHIEEAQPGGVAEESFVTASRSAFAGGTTSVVCFIPQWKGGGVLERHADAEARAKKGMVDYSFHQIIADPTDKVMDEEIPQLVAKGIRSLKVFLTYDNVHLSDAQYLRVLTTARRLGCLVTVHCENYEAINWRTQKLLEAGMTAPKYHAWSRPPVVEREATHRAIALAEFVDQPLQIFHVSCAEAAEEIARAQARGVKVWGETCPQYVTLTAADMDRPGFEGAKFMCSPAPRDAEEHDCVWDMIRRGVLDVISSDHCAFSFQGEKGKAQNGRDAVGVVDGAVIDPVALGVRRADAQVVPVGAVDDGLVRMLGPDDAAGDIVRDDHLVANLEVGREGRAVQDHRLERAGLGLLLQGVEVEAGLLEQVHRDVALDPGLELRMGLGRLLADDVEHHVGVRVLDRRPAIRGRGRLVDDQHAGGALAGGFLVLVGPAAIIGHGLAAEVADPGLEVRIVDQHDQDLALQVHALEVVPVPLGGLDAIADEDDRSVLDRHGVDIGHGGADRDLVALRPGFLLAADRDAGAHRAFDLELAQRHVLGPDALAVLPDVAGGRQADRLHLADDVADRLGLAGRGGAAPLEGVRGQDLDMGRQPGGVDLGRVGGSLRETGRRQNGRRDQGGGEQKAFHL